jgi:hypothetical protein
MARDAGPYINPFNAGDFPQAGNDNATSSFVSNGYKVTVTRPSPGVQYITTFDPKTGATNWMVVMDTGANFRITESGDIVLIGAKPNGAACGGKFIQKTPGDEIKKIDGKSHTEIGGNKTAGDGGDDTQGEEGPAYSLKVYGNAYIESQGGHLSMRGETVTLNAVSVLSMKSDKDIILQAGENGGKITMNAGTVETNCAFIKDNVSGGIYKSVPSGEETTTSIDPRSTVNIVSSGNIQHKILGDLKLQVMGKTKMDLLGGKTATGFDDLKEQVQGLQMNVATAGSEAISVKTAQDMSVNALNAKLTSGATTNITSVGSVTIKSSGIVDIDGTTILLN